MNVCMYVYMYCMYASGSLEPAHVMYVCMYVCMYVRLIFKYYITKFKYMLTYVHMKVSMYVCKYAYPIWKRCRGIAVHWWNQECKHRSFPRPHPPSAIGSHPQTTLL